MYLWLKFALKYKNSKKFQIHIGEIAIDAVDSAVLLVLKLLDDHLHVSNVLS